MYITIIFKDLFSLKALGRSLKFYRENLYGEGDHFTRSHNQDGHYVHMVKKTFKGFSETAEPITKLDMQ